MVEEKQPNKMQSLAVLSLQIFCLFIVLLGCLSFFLLFFCFKIFTAIGFLGTIVLLSSLCVGSSFLAVIGFKRVQAIAVQPKVSWFEVLSIYLISIMLTVNSVVTVVRGVPWALKHFLNLETRWDIPSTKEGDS
jgi:hypothetical protein